MSKKLRELGGLDDVSLHIPKLIVTQCLDYLWHIEEGDIYRMTLESSQSILKYEGMISIFRQKVCHCCYGVDRCPIQKVLLDLAF